MTATPTLSLLFHILYNAHMHINRQFFVRKQAQSVLISTMLNFGIRWVDLGHVPLPTAFNLQLASVFFRSRYIPAATLLLTSLATYSGFCRCDLYNTNCQLFLCKAVSCHFFFTKPTRARGKKTKCPQKKKRTGWVFQTTWSTNDTPNSLCWVWSFFFFFFFSFYFQTMIE